MVLSIHSALGTVLSPSYVLSLVGLSLWGGIYYYIYFTDEEPEA